MFLRRESREGLGPTSRVAPARIMREILGTIYPAGFTEGPARGPNGETAKVSGEERILPAAAPASAGREWMPENLYPEALGETPRVRYLTDGSARFDGRKYAVLHHAIDRGRLGTLFDSIASESKRRLEPEPLDSILGRLDSVLAAWRDAESPERKEAEELIPDLTGYSPAVVREGFERAFRAWSSLALEELVRREFGSAEALDGWRASRDTGRVARSRIVTPGVVQIVAAGNVPVTPLLSMLHALVLRSGALVKVSSRDPITPSLFARSFRRRVEGWGGLFAVVHGARLRGILPVGTARGAVIGFGGDETMRKLASEIPPAVPRVLYGHKLSLGFLFREAISSDRALAATASALARDVVAFDQQGCLSPLFYFYEDIDLAPSRDSLERIAGAIARELERRQDTHPVRTMDLATSSAISQWRGRMEAKAQAGAPLAISFSSGSLSWSVAVMAHHETLGGALPRVVRLLPAPEPGRLIHHLESVRGQLSTLSFAGDRDSLSPWEEELIDLGVSRIVPLGTMQDPALHWFHDGKPNLAPLVRWVDEESGYGHGSG